MKRNFIQVSVAACLLLQFSLQSCLPETDETQSSGFSGTIKETVNTGGVDVDAVKVHISPYYLDDLSGGGSLGGGSSNPAVQFFDGSIDDLHLRSKEAESGKMRAGGVDVDEGLATGTYENGGLTLNFLNPVPDRYLSSLLPETDAKVTGSFNSGGIKAYKNGTQVGCFFYANVDVNANMDNLTVGDAFAGFVYADRDVSINVSFVSIEAYLLNEFAESGLHIRKERLKDSPFGSKIFLKKGWNKLYLVWQQSESETEESGTGAGWEIPNKEPQEPSVGWIITNKEPSGMKWYFSEGGTAIQGKLRLNDLSLRLTNYPKTSGGDAFGTDSAVFERGDLIGIYMVDTIANAPFLNVLRANVAYKKVLGDMFMLATGTDSIRLPTSGFVKFFAYYPWDANTAWPDIFWSVQDQSDQSKLDLLVASDNNNGLGYEKPNNKVPLTFRHMLSKITINIKAGDGTNIDQNSITQVTMGVIGGSTGVSGRIAPADTVPLVATFHMDKSSGTTADGPGGYMDYPGAKTKRGVISFFPVTRGAKYTALVIPYDYSGKNIAIKLTERDALPKDYIGKVI